MVSSEVDRKEEGKRWTALGRRLILYTIYIGSFGLAFVLKLIIQKAMEDAIENTRK